MRRTLCWEHTITGDARRRGVIEHYCVGETCCPGDRPGLKQNMRGPNGICCLLNPAPNKLPRKPWAGQAEIVGHAFLQLELTGGMLSRSFNCLVQVAQARADVVAARLAGLAASRAALDADGSGGNIAARESRSESCSQQ